MATVEPFLVDGGDPRRRWQTVVRPPVSIARLLTPVIAFVGLVAASAVQGAINPGEIPAATWWVIGAMAGGLLVVTVGWFAPDAGVVPLLIARRTRRGWVVGRSTWARLGLRRVVVPEGRPCELLIRPAEEGLGIQFYDWILTGGGRAITLTSTLAPAPTLLRAAREWSARSGLTLNVVVDR